jgi:transposase
MLLDHPSDGPAAIRTQFGAIFVSLELSRSNWLITSLSPGKGEKMSKRSVTAGDVAELLKLFAELKRKTEVRTGQSYPIITIQEAGLDGFWIHRVLQQEGIESHVVDPASIATPRKRRRPRPTGSMARRCCGRSWPTSAGSRGSAQWWLPPRPRRRIAAGLFANGGH